MLYAFFPFNLMIIPFSDVSLVAVVLATVACMGLGTLWYGPLFGETWMKLAGIQKGAGKDEMKRAMTQGLIATLISNYFIALLLLIADIETLSGAAMFAVILAFATAVPGALHDVAWERKPFGLLYINGGHCIVSFAVAAVIIQSIA